jgi:hypothetical protein
MEANPYLGKICKCKALKVKSAKDDVFKGKTPQRMYMQEYLHNGLLLPILLHARNVNYFVPVDY